MVRKQDIGRRSKNYIRLRDRFRASCRAARAPCHLCGQPINYKLEAGHPDSFELDHFHTLFERPDLAEDPGNFRPSHKGCNASRGTKAVKPILGTPSEIW